MTELDLILPSVEAPVAMVAASKSRGSTLAWIGVTMLLLVGWALTVRPISMGGSAGYVMIRGVSMEPIYHTGDLVITRRAPTYRKGDIIAYHVPEGDIGAGITVIHRITGGSATEGFIVQGDNNPERDDWRPKPTDVVGKAWLHIPKLGLMLAFLHAPLPLASLATGIAIAFALFPEKEKKAS